jgi:hypothetical protein
VNEDLDDDEEELFKGGWLAIARYPAMLGGTLAGQLVGILIDVALDSRGLWIPAACSVLLEGAIGARFGGLNGEPRLDRAQALKVSMTYSLTILVVSAPLLVWVGLSHIEAVPEGVGLSFLTPLRVAVAVAVLAVATAVRAALFVLVAPRPKVKS